MFKSSQRAIIFPQSEHLRLVGALAYHWGNADFDLPLARETLTAGMAFHDRAYGYLDNHAIGEISEQDWLEIARRGFGMGFSDAAADIIARMHILRLVKQRPITSAPGLAEEMEQAIKEQVAQADLTWELFQRIDRITQITDRISFEFCFERQAEGRLAVFPRNDSTEERELSYRIAGETIELDPWPLDVAEVSGFLSAFREVGYPHRLDPVIVPYRIVPGRTTDLRTDFTD